MRAAILVLVALCGCGVESGGVNGVGGGAGGIGGTGGDAGTGAGGGSAESGWSRAEAILAPSARVGALPAGIDGEGNVTVVLRDDAWVVVRRYDGQEWTDAVRIDGQRGIEPDAQPLLAVEATGRAVATWDAADGGIVVSIFDPVHGTWSDPEEAYEELPGIVPGAVAVDAAGNVALAFTWEDEARGRWDQAVMFRFAATGEWHEQLTFDSATAPLQRASLFVEDERTVRVREVWLRRGHLDTASARFDLVQHDATMTMPLVLGDADDKATAELAVGDAGQEWVAFTGASGGLELQQSGGQDRWLTQTIRLSQTTPLEMALAAGEGDRAALLFVDPELRLWLSRWSAAWADPELVAEHVSGRVGVALGAGSDGCIAWSDGAAIHAATIGGAAEVIGSGTGEIHDEPMVLVSRSGAAMALWKRVANDGAVTWLASARKPLQQTRF